MKRCGTDTLLPLVESFFRDHLQRTRGASDHTVRAYRDALKLLFLFLADRSRCSVADLRLDDIRADAVLKFLQHLEVKRGNSSSSRNCRLAAIRSFAEHLLRHDVTRADQYGRILAIPAKRASCSLVSYLEPETVRAVIAAVRDDDRTCARDRALLLLLYNTGARISEALAIRPSALCLERPRQVRLFGKGGKERMCPLWAETAVALRGLALESRNDTPLFLNARGGLLTRDGVAYVIRKYVERATRTRPELRGHRVTPHLLRHSCAVALLQAGVDVTVIRDYLGHASITTTNRYITTNLEMKRNVLEAFWKNAGLDPRPRKRWRPTPKLLTFLASL